MSPARVKDTWGSWRDRPYATGDDKKRKQAEAFEALNTFVRKHNGWVTSPPGRVLRIEVMKGSELATKLTELGYHVARCGTVSRTTGAPANLPRWNASPERCRARSPNVTFSKSG